MTRSTDFSPARIGLIVLLVFLVASAGCIRTVQSAVSGGGAPAETPLPGAATAGPVTWDLVPADAPDDGSLAPAEPGPEFEADVVSPDPYITPDPYRLPYRDLQNRSESDLWVPYTVKRIPQFSKTFVLRSNSTAIRVNVTRGPLEIHLNFDPQFTDPDHSKIGRVETGGDEENSEVSGVQMSSFVYSNAEVNVINAESNGMVTRDGYNGIYSSDTKKVITIYREGPYVITLSGNFIDVGVKIFTGTAPQVTPEPTPAPEYDDWEEE